ncbi:hypothetical protein [Alteribacter natronophilus]|uniref:hypothetical protein n=1 Tax=Alteribacter natronophilus TaxID=2583810 RepID=UPI00110ED676|nr:hypothetical protein [Alteribacter natronophilus]TMW72057.1 hypothetical protein FGB90_07500 [Alteribacter natronophilus]
MMKKGNNGIQRGQAITFRLPSDTPDHLIRELQQLKEQEKRNFSSRIAQYALEGVSQSLQKERETLTIPLPKQLSKEQRNWIRHAHSEALLGNIVYQLLADPVRATSVLASLNSGSIDIEEALYLQEQNSMETDGRTEQAAVKESDREDGDERLDDTSFDDQLDNFDWSGAKPVEEEEESHKEESVDDLLGGFLDKMNR